MEDWKAKGEVYEEGSEGVDAGAVRMVGEALAGGKVWNGRKTQSVREWKDLMSMALGMEDDNRQKEKSVVCRRGRDVSSYVYRS